MLFGKSSQREEESILLGRFEVLLCDALMDTV